MLSIAAGLLNYRRRTLDLFKIGLKVRESLVESTLGDSGLWRL